jgi:hypothetical protein
VHRGALIHKKRSFILVLKKTVLSCMLSFMEVAVKVSFQPILSDILRRGEGPLKQYTTRPF